MKLKTMLLPTGKFVLIVQFDEDHEPLEQDQRAAFHGLRKDIGAVSCLMTNEDVVVEDALIDEGAIEHVEDVEFAAGGWVQPGATAEVNETGKDEQVLSAFQAVKGGAWLTPAGLLDLTDEQKAEHAGLTKADLESGTAELDDEAAAQVQQHHFPPTGRRSTDGCPCYPDGRMTVDASCDNCPLDRGFGDLAVGDRVRVTAEKSLYGLTGIQGYEGVVSRLQDAERSVTGEPVVWVGADEDDDMYALRPGDVERI